MATTWSNIVNQKVLEGLKKIIIRSFKAGLTFGLQKHENNPKKANQAINVF